jgi:hypothetical protein
MAKTKVPVTERALLQRINRKLRKEQDSVVKKARGENVALTIGEYFMVGFHSNAVMEQDVDLKKLGKELGVLRAWESL